jgi:N-acetyl-anhydromuramyl-L-alanine amidase AmpD
MLKGMKTEVQFMRQAEREIKEGEKLTERIKAYGYKVSKEEGQMKRERHKESKRNR